MIVRIRNKNDIKEFEWNSLSPIGFKKPKHVCLLREENKIILEVEI